MPLSDEARIRKNEQLRRWRREHPERHREVQREWRRRNPDKVRAIWKRTKAKNKATVNAGHRRWRANNAEKSKDCDRRKYLKRRNAIRAQKYAVPVAEVDRLMMASSCEACGVQFQPGSGCIDHDHETMAIRGVLCKPCNLALGVMFDSPERLRALADYAQERCVVPQCAAVIGRAILALEAT